MGIPAREVNVLVFDLCRTIIDMQQGPIDAISEEKDEKGWPYRFVTWWRIPSAEP